ncbi:histidine kinase [Variovorax sp. JS1663]|nr:histidine kinase [Variovorax sp. JS1663]
MSDRARRNAEYFERRRTAFAVVAIVGFPLYYFIWNDLFPQSYENLPLRLIGSALFLPIVFERHWQSRFKKIWAAYWYLALLYALPFFFTLMLFKNNSSAVWLESTLIAVFVMVLLLDWVTLIVHCVVGVGLAWLAYSLTTAAPRLEAVTLVHLPIFFFAIVIGTLANYVAELVRLEQERAMLATAGSIAHELRTPLLGIRSGAAGLRNYLPTLLTAYQLARENALPVAAIRKPHLEAIKGVLERIEAEANYSNAIINMLITNVRLSRPGHQDLSPCSMMNCIHIALERYPFSADEKSKVSFVTGADFTFNGVELLMVHVVFNLLKNSLHHIAKVDKGQIYIHTERSPQGNLLVFRDTAAGISNEVLPHIFKRFYSSSTAGDNIVGSGIGLAFCSDVVRAFGGTIDCSSVYGEFCEFSLKFPVIEL